MTPLRTAAFFVSCVIIVDATVVALVVEKNDAMCSSILGTWLLCLSIFVATSLTGLWGTGHRRRRQTHPTVVDGMRDRS
jgi:hypothetical protein